MYNNELEYLEHIKDKDGGEKYDRLKKIAKREYKVIDGVLTRVKEYNEKEK